LKVISVGIARLRDATPKNTHIFKVTGVRTSNLTYWYKV